MAEKGRILRPDRESAGQYGTPKVEKAEAIDELTVRVTFDQDMERDDSGATDDATNPANYTFVVTGGVSVSAVSCSVARDFPTWIDITLNREMTASSQIEVTVASTVKSSRGVNMDPNYDSYEFTGYGIRPTVDSATAVDGVIVYVDFDEDMNQNAALTLATNYVLTSPTDPTPPGVDEVRIQTGSRVELWLDSALEIGDDYTVTVSNVEDLAGNPIQGPPNNQADFVGVAIVTKLESAVPRDENTVRLTFDRQMKRADLADIGNFTLEPIEAGAAILYYSGVLLPADTYPTYVDIVCSEMTDGKDYRATVDPSVRDKWDNTISPLFDTQDFEGVGTEPRIVRVVASTLNKCTVVFDESMRDNADLRDPARYSFDKGLQVLAVLDVRGSEVDLSTSEQTAGELYTLTISQP